MGRRRFLVTWVGRGLVEAAESKGLPAVSLATFRTVVTCKQLD